MPTDRRPRSRTSRAEDAPPRLREQVRWLSTMLGEVLVETEGPELLEDVERLRRATIALRSSPSARRRQLVEEIVGSFDAARAEMVARAFTCYFQLVNLAEERHRVRELVARAERAGPVDDSLEAAIERVRTEAGQAALLEAVRALDVMPVLTAHPTEARRRTILETLARIGEMLARLDHARDAGVERDELERRLREEVTLLWRTAPVRRHRPTPLDEVRAVMALFDQTIFRLVPVVCRDLDRLAAPGSGTRPPAFDGVPVRWASWVGGDRDGNPHVTAHVSLEASKVASEHVFLGYEAATRRISRALSVSDDDVAPTRRLLAAIDRDSRCLPRHGAELHRRLPSMSHRLKLALASHRLAATRTGGDAAYAQPRELVDDLLVLQDSLARGGVPRLAFGEVQHLIWQVQTFGFHLAELEVRQHADVLAAAKRDGDEELEATFRAMHEIQQRRGPDACRRFIVSFTRGAEDVRAAYEVARAAVRERGFRLEVVPLFETRDALENAADICEEIAGIPAVRRRLARRGEVLEVMLGYSDSAKEAGVLAANVELYRAQVRLAAWAERRGIALRLFHGRGGALGRGGGPTNRAILGQPAGSVRGRFKATEQGEVAFSRYADAALGRRHLEQLLNAVLLASTPEHERAAGAAWDAYRDVALEMSRASERAWRELVGAPGFIPFFLRATPMAEIEGLPIGSRPSRRRETWGLDDVRAIPWVFSWAQTRVGLPGWFGVGAGLEAIASGRGGIGRLREMHRSWPFFSSFLENVQLSLAKADPEVGRAYLEDAGNAALTEAILDELDRTTQLVLRVTRQDRPLASRPVLRQAIDLRNPYVDALSFLQRRFLPSAREGDAAAAGVVQITVSGIAAGLQNTG